MHALHRGTEQGILTKLKINNSNARLFLQSHAHLRLVADRPLRVVRVDNAGYPLAIELIALRLLEPSGDHLEVDLSDGGWLI